MPSLSFWRRRVTSIQHHAVHAIYAVSGSAAAISISRDTAHLTATPDCRLRRDVNMSVIRDAQKGECVEGGGGGDAVGRGGRRGSGCCLSAREAFFSPLLQCSARHARAGIYISRRLHCRRATPAARLHTFSHADARDIAMPAIGAIHLTLAGCQATPSR